MSKRIAEAVRRAAERQAARQTAMIDLQGQITDQVADQRRIQYNRMHKWGNVIKPFIERTTKSLDAEMAELGGSARIVHNEERDKSTNSGHISIVIDEPNGFYLKGERKIEIDVEYSRKGMLTIKQKYNPHNNEYRVDIDIVEVDDIEIHLSSMIGAALTPP